MDIYRTIFWRRKTVENTRKTWIFPLSANIVLLPDPRVQPTLGITSAHQQGPATTKALP